MNSPADFRLWYNFSMDSVSKKRVGVLRGGTGALYERSLKRGGEIISHIFENLSDKYKIVDILIDKDGVWHVNGLPIVPADLGSKVDVAWNAAHPSLSAILDDFSIPNVGQGHFSFVLENSREMLREHMKKINVSMPRRIVFPVYQKDFDGPRERYAIKKAKEVFEKFSSPWIVKSFTPNLNMGIHLAKTFNELVAAIEDGVRNEKSILVEEFITGKVASMHSVSDFRGQDFYIFPATNVSGNLSVSEKEKLDYLIKELHKHIGAKHYLKSNFVLNKRGKVYLLDLESTPDLRLDSHFSKVCESVGAKMHDVVGHMIEKVLK